MTQDVRFLACNSERGAIFMNQETLEQFDVKTSNLPPGLVLNTDRIYQIIDSGSDVTVRLKANPE